MSSGRIKAAFVEGASSLVKERPHHVRSATRIDWLLLAIPVTLALVGVVTMHPFAGGASEAPRQLMWIAIGMVVFAVLAHIDMRFIRRMPLIVTGYTITFALLILLLLVVHPIMGARSWFPFGPVAFQPADLAKLVLIALLAKYFSRRHIEIANLRHIIVSGAYAAALTGLILVQPDLGTAVIMGSIWFGMILVSGVSKKHLAAVLLLGLVAGAGFWTYGLHPYQRARIVSFVNPALDPYGSGYNAYQAVVAAGSGELVGKGIGYGTQSKLQFLPQYQTDFVFAAFAEEWGFVGVTLILLLYTCLFVRLISIARNSATNFDALFTLGVMIVLFSHTLIHTGINLGLLPVTGTTIPFMSYGGSHLLMEFAGLGIVASLARHGRELPRTALGREYEGYGSV